MQVQGMGWSFPPQRANDISVSLKRGYVIFTEQYNRTMANAKTQDNIRLSREESNKVNIMTYNDNESNFYLNLDTFYHHKTTVFANKN